MPFIPLQRGFTPLEHPGILKQLALENPATAIGETALSVATQGVAMPVAGLAGLGVEAAHSLGLTERTGADTVQQVAEAMTYQPRGEMGKAATGVVMYPFEKLAELGQAAGGRVLEATDSPAAATAVDTAINAVPMLLGVGKTKAPMIGGREVGAYSDAGLQVLAKAHPDKVARALAEAEIHNRGRTAQPEALPADVGVHPNTVPVEAEAPISPKLAEWLNEAQPVTRAEADSVVSQARAAGYDGHEVIPLGDGFTVVPREWLTQPDPALTIEHPAVAMPEPAEQPGNVSATKTPLPAEVFAPDRPAPLEALPPERVVPDALQPHRGFTPLEPETQAMRPGTNYAPLIDDATLTGSAERRATPLRREDILSDLVKALDTTIYEGRVKQKGVLGTYTPRKETVRIKRAADVEVAGHEIAHLLDDRIPEIKEAYKGDKTFARELRSVSYDKTKLHEGFAEFVRLYMTQPEHAQAKAPGFYKWFDDFTQRHEYGPAIRKAQEDMGAWFNQDALDRARSKIGVNRKVNEAFDRLTDRFRQSTVDDLHGIYRMERDLKGGIVANGAYETARLSRASQSIAEGAVNFGHPIRKVDGSIDYAGKGLREILEPVAGNIDDALLYFVGRSAQELKMQGREHLFTGAEIQSMVDLATPERRKAFDDYQKWNRGVVDFAEAAGVINPSSRATWQRQAYMPFHRVGQPGDARAKPGDWSGIKALTGGTDNIKDVLGNMTGNAAMLIDKALKNEARQKIASLAETERGAGKFMTQIDPESRPVRIDKAQVLKAVMEAMGINKADPRLIKELEAQIDASPGMFELMVHNQAPAGGNVVAVLKHGKPTYYEVADPVLYRALSAVDRPVQSWLVRMLGMPKRVGQLAVTLTPDFMVANIARDTLMGSVMSRAGFRPVMDSLEGMRLRMTKDPLYKEYIANGGGLSSIYLDEGKLRARLEKFYQSQGLDYRTVLDAPDKLLGFVETLADAFETSTRLGEFKRARQRGEHPRHAAYLAREVSTDFAMRGDNPAVNFMYDTVMFLRPAMLSFDRLARGLAHDPNRAAIAAKSGALALFSMGLFLLNSEEERYRDLPDWDRDTHWHFFVGDQHFRYPKIWEIGALASIAERSLEAAVDGNSGGLGKSLARIVGQTFNLNLMPQILAPIYEQATNRNSFTGAMIETPGMENVQPFMRAKANTSQTLQALGLATRNLPEALQVNPVRTEALLRGYLSTWALYGLQLSDRALFSDQMPAARLDQFPVVRRFYAEDPPQHTKYEQQFYDMLGESERLIGTMKSLYKDGRRDLADEIRDGQQWKNYGRLEGTSKVLQLISLKMRQVRRDESLSPEAKREALDEWTRKRNDVLKLTVAP